MPCQPCSTSSPSPNCDRNIWSNCAVYDTGYDGYKMFLLPRTDADRLGSISKAVETCAKYNTITVSIHSENENAVFANWMYSVTTTVWLGGYREKNVFKWYDGTPISAGDGCFYQIPRNTGLWVNGFTASRPANCSETNTIVCQKKI